MTRDNRRHGGTRAGGFTLVELLVVVTIISLLMSLVLSAVPGTLRLARRVSCGSNLHGTDGAYKRWAGGHGGNFPKHRPAVGSGSWGATWVWGRGTTSGTNNIPDEVFQEQGPFIGPGALVFREYLDPAGLYCPAGRWQYLQYRKANPGDIPTGPIWPTDVVPASQQRMQVGYQQRSAIDGNRSPNTAVEKSWDPVMADAFDDQVFYDNQHPDGFNVLYLNSSVRFVEDLNQDIRYNYGVDGNSFFTTAFDKHEEIFKTIFMTK